MHGGIENARSFAKAHGPAVEGALSRMLRDPEIQQKLGALQAKIVARAERKAKEAARIKRMASTARKKAAKLKAAKKKMAPEIETVVEELVVKSIDAATEAAAQIKGLLGLSDKPKQKPKTKKKKVSVVTTARRKAAADAICAVRKRNVHQTDPSAKRKPIVSRSVTKRKAIQKTAKPATATKKKAAAKPKKAVKKATSKKKVAKKPAKRKLAAR
jgi:hypothetical protein